MNSGHHVTPEGNAIGPQEFSTDLPLGAARNPEEFSESMSVEMRMPLSDRPKVPAFS